MSKQPEALRLANMLAFVQSITPLPNEAAAELRRLHALNGELLEALQAAKNSLVAFKFLPGHGNAWEDSDEENLQAVDAAIAKATGEQQ